MNRPVTVLLPAFLTLFSVQILSAHEVADEESEGRQVLNRIFADWAKRRERIDRVSYTVSGTRKWPRGGMTRDAIDLPESDRTAENLDPPQTLTSEIKRQLRIDFTTGRHYFEWSHFKYNYDEQNLYRIHCNHMYDGKQVYSQIFQNDDPSRGVNRNEPKADLLIYKGDVPSAVFDADLLPLLYGHGIVNSGESRVRYGELRPAPDETVWSYVGDVYYRDIECVRIQLKNAKRYPNEFWIAPEMESSILKVLISPDAPRGNFVIDYQKTNHGWLVKSWTRTQVRTGDGTIQFVETLKVDDWSVPEEFDENTFRVEPQKGEVVIERSFSRNDQIPTRSYKSEIYKLDDQGEKIPLNPRLELVPTCFAGACFSGSTCSSWPSSLGWRSGRNKEQVGLNLNN